MIKDINFNKYLMLIVIIISYIPASGNGLESFMKFASRKGSMVSINRGAVIHDQKSGYVTGGSLLMRGPKPIELEPLKVQIPQFEFDPCTGSFDFLLGGFSFIKGAEFANYIKAVGVSSGAYVVKMMIKQQCPQCENILSELEAISRDINSTSFNQCQQGQAIAEGLINRYNAAQGQKCMMKSSIVKGGSDLHETMKKCQDNPDRYGEVGDEAELKSMLPDNYNLVWRALSQNSAGGSSDMKELMMSISGSVIGEKHEKIATLSTLPSLVEKEDLLEQYIGCNTANGEIKIYRCDDQVKCLRPIAQNQIITSKEDTLHGKVEKTLKSILNKIDQNKGELTDEEQALIEYSQIPIISLFEVELALKNKRSVNTLASSAEFIDVVCYDMVINFMQKMLIEARTAVDDLKIAQADNSPIDKFNKNVENVQNLLKDKKFHAMKKLQIIVTVKELLTKQYDVFEMRFNRVANNRSI